MARCVQCGRRWLGAHVSCGERPALEPTSSEEVPFPSIDGYQIVGVLGRGGFATVFRARRHPDGPLVAIKVGRPNHPTAAERMLREADAMRAIGPPHVPRVFESGNLLDGSPFIVMECLTHPTLAAKLEQLPDGMPSAEFASCADAILVALAAAHSCGYVHRDLKPENLFCAEKSATLVDFGLARSATQPVAVSPLTALGTILGTVEYMSPEQCEGKANVDTRADVYAMGAILYEMLTSRPPFWGSPAEIEQAHLMRRPRKPSEIAAVSREVETVVLRCLAKEPEQRFANAQELRAALRKAISAPSPSSPRTASSVQQASPASTERTPMGLLFFESRADTRALQEALSDFGGQIAHAPGDRYVAVFDQRAGENRVRRALDAVRALTTRGLSTRAIVDLAPVVVQIAAGTTRYFSPRFLRSDSYPSDEDADDVLFTSAAAALLPDLGFAPAAPRSHLLQLVAAERTETPSSEVPVGREVILRELIQDARGAIAGREPSLATVIGEAGHGKSHLASALIQKLEMDTSNCVVLALRARETVGGNAELTLRSLAEGVLGTVPAIPADYGRSFIAERLGEALAEETWPAVALSLGWLNPDHVLVRQLSAAPGALRTATVRAIGTKLRQLAASRPLCLVLDDAQFADEVTLDVLEYATLAEAEIPIWICVFARPSLERVRPLWAERAVHNKRVSLGALDEGNSEELCRQLLRPAEDIPAAIVKRLIAHTRGVPLLLVELVRGLKRDGLVRRRPNGGAWYLAVEDIERLPDLPLVQWLADRELAGLPRELANFARLAALLGDEFTTEEFRGIVDQLDLFGPIADFGLDPGVGLQRLTRNGILAGAHQLRFRHGLIRDAMYRSLSEDLRIKLHEVALHFYQEATLPQQLREPRLAFHAARCGRHAEARDAYFALAAAARARHGYLDAELLYTNFLDHVVDADERMHLEGMRGRATMRYRLGRFDAALDDFAKSRALAQRLGDRKVEAEIVLDEATCLDWIDEWRRSRDLAEEVRSLASGFDSPFIRAGLLMALGRSAVRFGDNDRAADLLAQAARHAEALGDAGYEILVVSLSMNGYVLASLGRLSEAAATFDRVIPLCEQHGDLQHLGGAFGNRTFLWTCMNDGARLLADLQREIAIARELGHHRLEWQGRIELARYYYWIDNLVAAEEETRRAKDLIERRFGDAARPETAVLLARVLLARGDTRGAREVLDSIRSRQAIARARGLAEVDLLPTEEVFFDMVDYSLRTTSNQSWEELIGRGRQYLNFPEQVELFEVRARNALASGEKELARTTLELASRLCRDVPGFLAARIERMRSSL